MVSWEVDTLISGIWGYGTSRNLESQVFLCTVECFFGLQKLVWLRFLWNPVVYHHLSLLRCQQLGGITPFSDTPEIKSWWFTPGCYSPHTWWLKTCSNVYPLNTWDERFVARQVPDSRAWNATPQVSFSKHLFCFCLTKKLLDLVLGKVGMWACLTNSMAARRPAILSRFY